MNPYVTANACLVLFLVCLGLALIGWLLWDLTRRFKVLGEILASFGAIASVLLIPITLVALPDEVTTGITRLQNGWAFAGQYVPDQKVHRKHRTWIPEKYTFWTTKSGKACVVAEYPHESEIRVCEVLDQNAGTLALKDGRRVVSIRNKKTPETRQIVPDCWNSVSPGWTQKPSHYWVYEEKKDTNSGHLVEWLAAN